MQWHLEGCKHKPCHKSKENLHMHHHHHHGSQKKLHTATSVASSAATTAVTTATTGGGGGCGGSNTTPRPSQLSNLRNSSERIIKDIIELRKRSHILQERLEHEIKVWPDPKNPLTNQVLTCCEFQLTETFKDIF